MAVGRGRTARDPLLGACRGGGERESCHVLAGKKAEKGLGFRGGMVPLTTKKSPSRTLAECYGGARAGGKVLQ